MGVYAAQEAEYGKELGPGQMSVAWESGTERSACGRPDGGINDVVYGP